MRARFSISFIFLSVSLFGIETNNIDSLGTTKLILKSDFMSQHLWRGYAMCDVPTVEPTLELSNKNYKAGIWSALSIDGKYFEFDTYVKISYLGFSLAVYDYYCPGSISSKQSFFSYKKNTTKHTLDLHIEYESKSAIPVRVILATMFYGDDISLNTNKNNYSTYLELACSSPIDKINLEYFLGFNLFESYYGNTSAIINAGIKSASKINFLKKKPVNMQASIVTNPLINRVYLVFGFGL